jgi:hypothetical protein
MFTAAQQSRSPTKPQYVQQNTLWREMPWFSVPHEAHVRVVHSSPTCSHTQTRACVVPQVSLLAIPSRRRAPHPSRFVAYSRVKAAMGATFDDLLESVSRRAYFSTSCTMFYIVMAVASALVLLWVRSSCCTVPLCCLTSLCRPASSRGAVSSRLH